MTIVFAALAVTRFIEDRTGWSIKRFVRTARRYRHIQVALATPTLTAEHPLTPDMRDALALIKQPEIVRTHMKRLVKLLQVVRRGFGGLGGFGAGLLGRFWAGGGVPMP